MNTLQKSLAVKSNATIIKNIFVWNSMTNSSVYPSLSFVSLKVSANTLSHSAEFHKLKLKKKIMLTYEPVRKWQLVLFQTNSFFNYHKWLKTRLVLAKARKQIECIEYTWPLYFRYLMKLAMTSPHFHYMSLILTRWNRSRVTCWGIALEEQYVSLLCSQYLMPYLCKEGFESTTCNI